MASTTTIRVWTDTRDSLAAQARARNMSVTVLVAELAQQAERADMFRRERELWVAEAAKSSNDAEMSDWDSVSTDGLD